MVDKLGINLILLGDGAVGKTSLMQQYVKGEFSSDHIATLGLDFQI